MGGDFLFFDGYDDCRLFFCVGCTDQNRVCPFENEFSFLRIAFRPRPIVVPVAAPGVRALLRAGAGGVLRFLGVYSLAGTAQSGTDADADVLQLDFPEFIPDFRRAARDPALYGVWFYVRVGGTDIQVMVSLDFAM